jgi:acyl carrier protein
MTRDDIQRIVISALAAVNAARDPRVQEPLQLAPDATIFGPGSPLDSLGLVGLLVDIEDALRDEGHPVSLSDSRAMSQSRSPFRSVPSLVAYIDELLMTTR